MIWIEIQKSIVANKTRSLLTGLGIAWGIFILILLLGMGQGFERGVFKLFQGFSKSTVYIYGTATTKEYKGTAVGQQVLFVDDDLQYLKNNVPEIDLISPEMSEWGDITYMGQKASYEIKGVSPSYFKLKLLDIKEGRVLNPADIAENRKVVLIGSNVAEFFFDNQSPVGQLIQINDNIFTVIGVIANDLQNQYEDRQIYMTYQAFHHYIDPNLYFRTMVVSLTESAHAPRTLARIRLFLSYKHQIHPEDEKAYYFNSMNEQIQAFNNLFSAVRSFLWFMGISTLLSGIIGVANIMYVSAKERTREIGIRKAVGAKNRTIKAMFIFESILITSVAGYIGMLLGVGTLQLIGSLMNSDQSLFDKPSVDIATAVAATLVLIISGTLAGLKPAAYAANLNPIESLREE